MVQASNVWLHVVGSGLDHHLLRDQRSVPARCRYPNQLGKLEHPDWLWYRDGWLHDVNSLEVKQTLKTPQFVGEFLFNRLVEHGLHAINRETYEDQKNCDSANDLSLLFICTAIVGEDRGHGTAGK